MVTAFSPPSPLPLASERSWTTFSSVPLPLFRPSLDGEGVGGNHLLQCLWYHESSLKITGSSCYDNSLPVYYFLLSPAYLLDQRVLRLTSTVIPCIPFRPPSPHLPLFPSSHLSFCERQRAKYVEKRARRPGAGGKCIVSGLKEYEHPYFDLMSVFEIGHAVYSPVSYTHLTLPTRRTV